MHLYFNFKTASDNCTQLHMKWIKVKRIVWNIGTKGTNKQSVFTTHIYTHTNMLSLLNWSQVLVLTVNASAKLKIKRTLKSLNLF